MKLSELLSNRLIRAGVVAALLGVAVAGVAWLFIFFSGGTGEASEPISAPQLTLPPATAAPASAAPTTAAPATAAPATAAPQPEATPATAAVQATGDARLFRIVPEESEARYEIDELLRGEPTRVVGLTDQVAGDIIVDFANASASQVGVIRINVRTMETPEDRRDRAVRSRILQSAEDQFEFVDFTPTALEGLPDAVSVGDTVSFTIVGDLKVRDITAEARFQATITVVAEDRLEGTAQATVLRSTYNLVIPQVPFVADVGEEVLLGIRFVATAVDQ